MMDLETVQGIMEVIMTAQMISRIVITIMMMTISIAMMMILFTVMKASVSASSAAAAALAVTSPDAVRRWDSSLRVYFAQVLLNAISILLNLMMADKLSLIFFITCRNVPIFLHSHQSYAIGYYYYYGTTR